MLSLGAFVVSAISSHHRVMEILEGGMAFLFLAASDSTYEQSDSSESKASRPFTSFIWDGFTVVCRSDRTNESDLIPATSAQRKLKIRFLLMIAKLFSIQYVATTSLTLSLILTFGLQ